MKIINHPAAKAELVGRIGKITATTQPKWGRMTAHQMVCHLNDSHLLAIGQLKAADKSNPFTRTILKSAALRLPMKWPPDVPTAPELDQVAGAGTPPVQFESDRARLLQLVDRFSASSRDFEFVRHPGFGRMSEWEWMRWAFLHADHHLRQFGL
jgi:hypothetical protein